MLQHPNTKKRNLCQFCETELIYPDNMTNCPKCGSQLHWLDPGELCFPCINDHSNIIYCIHPDEHDN
jgi:hypothetical protein